MRKYYRDLEPGEELQPRDEKQQWPLEWAPVDPAFYGANPGAYRLEYRRPVNLPVLQPVTPEAMAELESREAVGVLVASEHGARILSYSRRGYWWRGDVVDGFRADRPTRGWFIELETLMEVQQ